MPKRLFEATLDNIQSMLVPDPTRDRAVTTEYDRVNRAVRVLQPEVFVFSPSAGMPGGQYFTARPTTVSQYDAFGQVIKQSRLVNPGQALSAESYSYFDERGMRTAQVDELGYLTTFEYDAYGNTVRTVEYAKPLAAGSWSATGYGSATVTNATTSPNDPVGYDRITEFTFDSRNRLISQRRAGVAYSAASSAGIAEDVADDVTTYAYDALGNQTRVTDSVGAATYTYYDVLGRQIAIAAPTRDRGDGSVLTPFVSMRRDAFGNMVEQRVYAFGAATASETGFTASETISDRISRTLVDPFNHAIQSQDANGANSFISYTARGDIGREWQPLGPSSWDVTGRVTGYTYDQLGRQTSTATGVDTFSGYGGAGEIYIVAVQHLRRD